MLICKPFARATDTALHFIKNHQPIVAIAKLANSTHRFIRNRNNAAFALHGFKHDGTDTRRRGRQLFNHLDVACGHTDKVRQIRREVSAHVGVARCRERRDRTTVERMVKHNDLGLVEALEMPVFACKLDGGFIGFQAGIAEEATAQAAFFAELGGNLFLQVNAEIVRDMNQLGHLLLKRRYQSGMIVPHGINGNSRKAVKIDVALRVGEPYALPFLETHGKRRKNRKQVRLRHFYWAL